MAIINGMYIHVVDESVSREVDATSHPVESGIAFTDTVRPKAISISISGKIVDYGEMKAEQVISKLKSLQDSGSLIEYRGRNVASSFQIRSFETQHPNTINGGADFSMELVQVRIAKSAYVPKKEIETVKQETAKKEVVNTEIKVGDTVVFKGGPVYRSSDAKKRAATRKRSTCKVNIINKRSWSKHDYNLKSLDGGRVSGWCNKEDIEGVQQASTSGTTNAGTQQVSSGSSKKVTHTTKKGDTVYNLANKTYKSTGATVNSIIKNNPNAFTKKGDVTTLKVGVKLTIMEKRLDR